MGVNTSVIDLANERVLLTGGARGIGRGMAETFAQWGANVAVLDIGTEGVESCAESIKSYGVSGLGLAVDVTDQTAVEGAVDQIWSAFGGIDLLVNNAGVLSVSPVAELEVHEWRRVLDVNATGTFIVSKAVVRRLLASKHGGSIVSISSIGGKRGDPGIAHYAASKFAVIGFTQALAREVAENDILVNAVCPGLVETRMIADMASQSRTSFTQWVKNQAIGRSQTPRDIAFAVAFLHKSRAMTGQAINVDGGTVFN